MQPMHFTRPNMPYVAALSARDERFWSSVIPTDQISNSDMEELKLLAALKKMVSPKQDKK